MRMESLGAATTCLVMCLPVGCATKAWEYPYPPVPAGKPPAERPWFSHGQLSDGHFRHDAVERIPANQAVFQTIDKEVDQTVKSHPMNGTFGFAHTWSGVKRRILYWKYGVDWYSPADMTPGVIVD